MKLTFAINSVPPHDLKVQKKELALELPNFSITLSNFQILRPINRIPFLKSFM